MHHFVNQQTTQQASKKGMFFAPETRSLEISALENIWIRDKTLLLVLGKRDIFFERLQNIKLYGTPCFKRITGTSIQNTRPACRFDSTLPN